MVGLADFSTPDEYARKAAGRTELPRGRLLIASCRSGRMLSESVVERSGNLLSAAGHARRFAHMEDADSWWSEGEISVRLDADANRHDVFMFQAL